jgi:hypothetical protein
MRNEDELLQKKNTKENSPHLLSQTIHIANQVPVDTVN